MKTYQYKEISCSLPSGVSKLVKEMNALGAEGWELVSVCPFSSSEYGLDGMSAFLKKEVEK